MLPSRSDRPRSEKRAVRHTRKPQGKVTRRCSELEQSWTLRCNAQRERRSGDRAGPVGTNPAVTGTECAVTGEVASLSRLFFSPSLGLLLLLPHLSPLRTLPLPLPLSHCHPGATHHHPGRHPLDHAALTTLLVSLFPALWLRLGRTSVPGFH